MRDFKALGGTLEYGNCFSLGLRLSSSHGRSFLLSLLYISSRVGDLGLTSPIENPRFIECPRCSHTAAGFLFLLKRNKWLKLSKQKKLAPSAQSA
jgi:hypothetical protein